MVNRDELRAEIARKNVSRKHIAEALGISATGLSLKMAGTNEFKESEIKTLVSVLDLSAEDVNRIFLS